MILSCCSLFNIDKAERLEKAIAKGKKLYDKRESIKERDIKRNIEKELIKVLDKKKIPYYSCIKELNIDDNKLYFLNNKDYGNENDNSSVIYTELNNNKFLFMGDSCRASIDNIDQTIIDDLKDIYWLKVPHHGSKHNLNTEIIDRLQPQQSAICCAGTKKHPNSSVVYWLSKYGNVYSTHKNSFYYHSGPSISAATPLKEKIH